MVRGTNTERAWGLTVVFSQLSLRRALLVVTPGTGIDEVQGVRRAVESEFIGAVTPCQRSQQYGRSRQRTCPPSDNQWKDEEKLQLKQNTSSPCFFFCQQLILSCPVSCPKPRYFCDDLFALGYLFVATPPTAPILEILGTALKECRMTQVDSTRFADDVKFYAPGYLAMEAEGRAAEYDPELLLRRLMN